MPSPFALYPYQTGDRVTLKKPHPCGGFVWVVMRTGADIALRCETCGHLTVIARQPLEKRTKKVEKPANQPTETLSPAAPVHRIIKGPVKPEK